MLKTEISRSYWLGRAEVGFYVGAMKLRRSPVHPSNTRVIDIMHKRQLSIRLLRDPRVFYRVPASTEFLGGELGMRPAAVLGAIKVAACTAIYY